MPVVMSEIVKYSYFTRYLTVEGMLDTSCARMLPVAFAFTSLTLIT